MYLWTKLLLIVSYSFGMPLYQLWKGQECLYIALVTLSGKGPWSRLKSEESAPLPAVTRLAGAPGKAPNAKRTKAPAVDLPTMLLEDTAYRTK